MTSLTSLAPVVINFAGSLLMMYRNSDGSLSTKFSADGANWIGPYAVESQYSMDKPSVVYWNNTLWAIYMSNGGDNHVYITNSTDGVNWSYPNSSLDMTSDESPTLLVANGTLWMFTINQGQVQCYVLAKAGNPARSGDWGAGGLLAGVGSDGAVSAITYGDKTFVFFAESVSNNLGYVYSRTLDQYPTWTSVSYVNYASTYATPVATKNVDDTEIYLMGLFDVPFDGSGDSWADVPFSWKSSDPALSSSWVSEGSLLSQSAGTGMSLAFFESAIYFFYTNSSSTDFLSLMTSDFSSWSNVSPVKTSSVTLIMTGDPQYVWVETGTDTAPLTKDQYSYMLISQQYASINSYAVSIVTGGSPMNGVCILGDLTDFGYQNGHLGVYEQLRSTLRVPSYIMLGNHDYANNVDDCTLNLCASRMVDYFFDFLRDAAIDSYDFEITSDTGGSIYNTGSLAYSYNLGRLHVVNLSNYATYTRMWTMPVLAPIVFIYNIQSSLTWLEADLQSARQRGDAIIICTHDYPCGLPDPGQCTSNFLDTSAFDQLLIKYNVSAVFSAHCHGIYGFRRYINIFDNKIPLIFSGSATAMRWLSTGFDLSAGNFKFTEVSNDKSGNYTVGTQSVSYPLYMTEP